MTDGKFARREVLALSALATGVSTLSAREVKAALPTVRRSRLTVPNGVVLESKKIGDARVFHLIPSEVEHAFAPGLVGTCWGYNGHVHGPVIEATEGELVRIYVTNKLPAPTTVHWHGLLLPCGMDGVGGLTQKAISPGETYKYEFRLRQNGTFMYHAHHDEMTQMALGLTGLFIVHPAANVSTVDRDFAIMLHEWRLDPGTRRPNPNEMTDFNLLTMNGKVYPATDPLVVQKGDRVRIRLGNLSAMDHHPIHLHGYSFKVTETDGGRIPPSGQWPETTVLVPTGSTRTIEFVADAIGDWAMHCHMTHHVMNQMGHGIPNMLGVKTEGLDERVTGLLPGYMSMGTTGMGEVMKMAIPENSVAMVNAMGQHDVITMGGMFTVLKVRERVDGQADPGWYEAPVGTTATIASAADLLRDGITAE